MEHHISFNNLDYIVLGIILLSGILALFRGLVREVFSLIAWTGAYFAAARFHPLAEPWLSHYIHSKELIGLVAGTLVFVAVLVVLTVIGSLVAQLIKGHALTAIDRSLGFIFGLLRGALVVCIAYLAVVTVLWPDIDNPPTEPTTQTEPTAQADGSGNTGGNSNVGSSRAPAWLTQAKTRPFMAYGAEMLKVFIPEKEIEKTTQEYIDQRAAAQHVIDQKKLDMLSTPAPTPAASGQAGAAPAYDDKNRSNLDQLINQQGKP